MKCNSHISSVITIGQAIIVYDKVLYEEIMTNNDNLESYLLTSSLLKIRSLYKFCYMLSPTSVKK